MRRLRVHAVGVRGEDGALWAMSHRLAFVAGLVMQILGLERVLNSYLLGRVPHAPMRLVIGLVCVGIGSVLVSVGLLVFRAPRPIPRRRT